MDNSRHAVLPLRREGFVHEALLHLYLRLSGYFTTGLICHASQKGNNLTEIDCVAVRHTHHSHPDIDVPDPPFLALDSTNIDFLICESKSNPARVKFNSALSKTPRPLELTLRWSGLIRSELIDSVVKTAMPMFAGAVPLKVAQAGVVVCGVRIRGLLSCPRLAIDSESDRWILRGNEIIRYLALRLSPAQERPNCSIRYDFTQWGWLSPAVQYFKELPQDASPTLEGLHQYWQADRELDGEKL